MAIMRRHTPLARIADIYSYNVTIMGNCVMIVMMFSWLACKTKVSLIILCIIYGCSSGAFVSMQAPLVVNTATDLRFAGTMVGQALCWCFCFDRVSRY
jgi:hypothetical protein